MQIVMEIAALVFPVFASYALRSHGVTQKLAELLSREVEGLSASQLQRLIAPRAQWVTILTASVLGATVLGLAFHLLPWYGALALFAGSCLLVLLMNFFTPSEKTRHYLLVILKNFDRRIARCEAEGDEEQAAALRDLGERLKSVSARKQLFEDKGPTY
ncbi:MAG: hypothetical protein IT573_03475 [Deltaproteobacteria bacterium]|nr:hypothetical protein [Deltaproteobacteria bacterium]